MAKLSREDSGKLLSMMEKPGWEVLLKLVAMTIADLEGRKTTGENEFQVLKSLFTKEAKVDALKEFFNDIDRAMSD